MKLKRKLIMSIFTLLVTIISLTTSTFAWLTANSIATTNIITGSTGADKNLFVKGDADEYFSNVATFRISESNFVFTNTTIRDDKFVEIESTTPGINGNSPTVNYKETLLSTVLENDINVQSGGYMTFNVKFQAPLGYDIHISKADIKSMTVNPFVLKADAGNDISVSKGNSITVKLEDALTLSYKGLDEEGNLLDRVNYRNVAVNTNDKHSALTYYNNIMNYLKPENIILNDNQVIYNDKVLRNNQGVIEYSNTNLLSPLAKLPNDINELGNYIPVTNETDKVETGNIAIILWLDGWDNDCFDAIRNQNLNISFQFSLVKKEN